MIVSNCHKIPSGQFVSELLTVDEIVNLVEKSARQVAYTLSPVESDIHYKSGRHWKDGAHGNQVSKSALFLAVEELLKHPASPGYFPAYELVIDDLRDYRFYSDDMLHPSDTAINYIWEAFSGCYLEDNTIKLYNEVVKITKACNHRFITDSPSKIKRFCLKNAQSDI